MDSLAFCYWLQGYFELTGNDTYQNLSSDQTQIIKDHLKLVFNKVTPGRSTQKVEDFFKYPHCESTTVSADPNARSYCAVGSPNPDILKYLCNGSC